MYGTLFSISNNRKCGFSHCITSELFRPIRILQISVFRMKTCIDEEEKVVDDICVCLYLCCRQGIEIEEKLYEESFNLFKTDHHFYILKIIYGKLYCDWRGLGKFFNFFFISLLHSSIQRTL